MNSLQDIAYKSLLSKLPSDVVEKLQEKALERDLGKILDDKKRRNICIMRSEGISKNYISICHEFKNATKKELPFLMKEFPNDDVYNNSWVSLFNLLILKHKDELKGNKMFKDVLVEEYYTYQHSISRFHVGYIRCLTCKVSPELITELYTNILSYKDLIEDINEVLEEFFAVHFKD